MSGPRRAVGQTRTAEGRRVDARACPRFDARACPVRVRVLGVSRVLAVWRCLIYARKVGVYLRNQGEAQSQTPTFYSRTSGCPRGGGHMVGVLSALGRNTPPTYASIHLPGALPLEPAICLVRIRDGGRAVASALCGRWIRWGWFRGFDRGTGSSSRSHPWTRAPRTRRQERRRRRYNNDLKWLVKVAARSVAGSSRTEQLAHERGPAAAAAQEVAGAGGPQSSQGGIWRCLMRCKVGVWTVIPPQHSWYIYTPHFYSSSAARPFFTHQGCVLLDPAPPLCGGHRSPRRSDGIAITR